MANMERVEIMAVGTWNGKEFTTDDLDEMVRGFEAEQQAGRLPVKLGHSAPDTDPARGWLSHVCRVGDRLEATLSDVPDDVVREIREGLYRFCSVEVLRDVTTAAGRTYRYLLDGLALLGSARPAVDGLKPLHESLSRQARGLTFAEALTFTRPFSETHTMNEVDQLREQLAAQTQQLVALTLEGAVRDGRILPAAREMFYRRHKDRGTVAEAAEWIATSPRPERFTRSASRPPDYLDSSGGPDTQLVERVRARIAEHFAVTQGRERLTFERAAAEVVRETARREPTLLEAWRVQNGESD